MCHNPAFLTRVCPLGHPNTDNSSNLEKGTLGCGSETTVLLKLDRTLDIGENRLKEEAIVGTGKLGDRWGPTSLKLSPAVRQGMPPRVLTRVPTPYRSGEHSRCPLVEMF